MEMEGSGGSQSQLIHPTVDVDEAALAVTKRARKRSRYLSPPYTMDTDVQEEKAAGSHKQRQEEEDEEEEGPPHVSAAEVLSALRATTLGQWEGMGMDAAALRFLAMYTRNRNSVFVNGHCDSHAVAGGGSQDDGGNKPPSLSSAGVMLNLNVGPDDGSLAKKKNPHPPAAAGAIANAKQQKENAAVLEHAIIATHGHGHASQSPGFVTTATHGHPNPPPVVTTAVTSLVHNEKKKKRRSKKRFKTIGQHSYSYVGSPVALVLDFGEGTPLPSREDLFSTFSRFGVVIDSETSISQDKRTARVAFATRAQAESALSCAATLGGAFGPPFAVASLQDLALNTPLPKLPLPVIRNNLGKMIVSLSSKATVDSLSLVGEMQRLLAKVDKALQVQRASAAAHHA